MRALESTASKKLTFVRFHCRTDGFLDDWITERFLTRFGRNLRKFIYRSESYDTKPSRPGHWTKIVPLIVRHCRNLKTLCVSPEYSSSNDSDLVSVVASSDLQLEDLELYDFSFGDETPLPKALVKLGSLKRLKINCVLGWRGLFTTAPDLILGGKLNIPAISSLFDAAAALVPPNFPLSSLHFFVGGVLDELLDFYDYHSRPDDLIELLKCSLPSSVNKFFLVFELMFWWLADLDIKYNLRLEGGQQTWALLVEVAVGALNQSALDYLITIDKLAHKPSSFYLTAWRRANSALLARISEFPGARTMLKSIFLHLSKQLSPIQREELMRSRIADTIRCASRPSPAASEFSNSRAASATQLKFLIELDDYCAGAFNARGIIASQDRTIILDWIRLNHLVTDPALETLQTLVSLGAKFDSSTTLLCCRDSRLAPGWFDPLAQLFPKQMLFESWNQPTACEYVAIYLHSHKSCLKHFLQCFAQPDGHFQRSFRPFHSLTFSLTHSLTFPLNMLLLPVPVSVSTRMLSAFIGAATPDLAFLEFLRLDCQIESPFSRNSYEIVPSPVDYLVLSGLVSKLIASVNPGDQAAESALSVHLKLLVTCPLISAAQWLHHLKSLEMRPLTTAFSEVKSALDENRRA